MTICTLTLPFPGVRRVFEEGEKLGFWKSVILEGSKVAIPHADVYILGAWAPVYERLLSLGDKIGVLVSSSIGEMDFTPVEWEYLGTILPDPRIDFVWFGCEALAKLFPQKGFYAPYPLAPMDPIPVEKQDIITLFCPGGPKKNIGNILAGVALLQRDMGLILHTNVAEYQPVMELLGVKYVLHPWLPREEYNILLARARVNLAVSWAATFEYQVAEAGMLGTPSAVSPTVGWMPDHCQVHNPNNPHDISEKVFALVKGSTAIREWVLGVAKSQNRALQQALRQQGLLQA